MLNSAYTIQGGFVKSPTSQTSGFRLPDLLRRLSCSTPRRIYLLAWSISDAEGVFTVDPKLFPFSERTRQRWLKRLTSWHLLDAVDAGGGRGRHPIYRVRGKAEFIRKKTESSRKPRHDAKDFKPPTPPLQDKSPAKRSWKCDPDLRRKFFLDGWLLLRKDTYGYKRAAQLFRIPLEELGLAKSSAHAITGVILRQLEGQSVQAVGEIYRRFGAWLWSNRGKLRRLLSKGMRRVCSWVAWALSKLLRGSSPEPPSSSMLRGHSPKCECLECERAQVLAKRAPYEKSWEERLCEWQAAQEAPRSMTRRLCASGGIEARVSPSRAQIPAMGPNESGIAFCLVEGIGLLPITNDGKQFKGPPVAFHAIC